MQKFLKYLPIPVIVLLVLGIVLVFIYKYLIAGNPAITRRKNLSMGFVFSLALGLIGLFAFVFFNSNITWFFIGAQVWILAMGWIFWSMMKRGFSPFYNKMVLTEWIFMLIPVTFGAMIYIYLFEMFNNNNIVWWFASCYLCFFIPYMIDLAFRKFAAIPPEIYKVWYYPADFEEPDFKRFPCLGLAYQALASGGNMPAVLNAANEIAVESFLKERMKFTAVPAMIEHVMQTVQQEDMVTLDDVLRTDTLARDVAREWLANLQ